MNRPPTSLLEEEIRLLVRHFGIKRVRAALAKVSPQSETESETPPHTNAPRHEEPLRSVGIATLDSIRQSNPEKYALLSEFRARLNDRQILPESQDIRQFAQMVGLKEIAGKSRKDLIPKLLRFLLEQPVERLRLDLDSAANISEANRQRGFSVLADKLLGKQ